MEQEDKIEEINSKRRVAMLLNILSYFMAVLFTLVGTISCVSLMMLLHDAFKVPFLMCFFMTLILPYFYSYVVNSLINCVDTKRDCILSEISFLEEEYNHKIDVSHQQLSENLSMRFGKLSRKKQLKLLSFVRGNLPVSNQGYQIDALNYDEMLKLMCELDKEECDCSLEYGDLGYSRRRIISEEIDK